MCGRYTLTDDGRDLWQVIEDSLPDPLRLNLDPPTLAASLQAEGRRRYNIVPTSHEPILLWRRGGVEMVSAHWWLLPSWCAGRVAWRTTRAGTKSFAWKGPPRSHFNSRWDTVRAPFNRYWNGLLESRRCLVPADGFVEWPDDALRDPHVPKIPRYFSLHEHRPFFFAGLYDETVDDEGRPFLSFNILTVEPNEMLRKLPHHRMPAILPAEAAAAWLSPEVKASGAAGLLRPTEDRWMVSHPVSTLVNAPANEFPGVLDPAPEP